VLTGSARLAQEARDREEILLRSRKAAHSRAELVAQRRLLGAQMASLQAQLAAVSGEQMLLEGAETRRERRFAKGEMRKSRRVTAPLNGVRNGR
jgi:circadian clock protein KaiC